MLTAAIWDNKASQLIVTDNVSVWSTIIVQEALHALVHTPQLFFAQDALHDLIHIDCLFRMLSMIWSTLIVCSGCCPCNGVVFSFSPSYPWLASATPLTRLRLMPLGDKLLLLPRFQIVKLANLRILGSITNAELSVTCSGKPWER